MASVLMSRDRWQPHSNTHSDPPRTIQKNSNQQHSSVAFPFVFSAATLNLSDALCRVG